MIDKLKKLTDGLIIFSALVSDFEVLDFKSDALAGVRANYFNSSTATQSDKTEVVLDTKLYNLSYFMCNNKPLSWKITRNNRPYQSVKRAAGSVYCVIVYGENGIINKRIYFDDKHNWLRTEYYDKKFENILLATLFPKNIKGIVALRLERIDSNGMKITEDLFPSCNVPKSKSTALVYSNAGMLWYDKNYKPKNLGEYEILTENNNIGFNFKIDSFNFSNDNNDILKLATAEYLSEEIAETISNDNTETKTEITSDNETYSAYDKIERILSEAHKSNKNLFGEIINQVANASFPAVDSCEDSEKLEVSNEDDTIIEENDVLVNNSIEDEISDIINSDDVNEIIIDSDIIKNIDKNLEEKNEEIIIINDIICEENENVSVTKAESSDFLDIIDDFEYQVSEEKRCDVVIHTKTGKYSYFGPLDDNNCRSGKGRTVTPTGNTSYEGEYKDDKRNGFGVCYYNEGNINYVGNWSDGNRNGCGVGYRLSDGTMHIGKWNNNTPTDFGARFDNMGNFIDVATYSDGKKNGKSISFDDDGNIIIRKYKNGELLSEKIIFDEEQ